MAAQGALGLIGGTSLLAAAPVRRAQRREVETPYGPVSLLQQERLWFLQRHGLDGYTPPHRINHEAHLLALQQVGVQQILAVGSVGSLRMEIPPGTLVVPDDFYAPQVSPSFFADQRGHRPPGFHRGWRSALLHAWQKSALPLPVDGAIYWQTTGPRFETAAEIRLMAPHVHLVGMTVASEAILAGELAIPYAALCMVDNFANGLMAQELSYESFKAQVHANEERLLLTLQRLLEELLG
ncbi:MTAP family purine nucleoside phosphorylase [Candidatus Magnetaquicoccus inordinatus]|uniref:MTAP family purine nucleoside phosphorylase n=1 Tax=Candidatus Magnetaquicoccus inordinatus TaxID=2496818 RepID=UPI00187D5D4F|nr:MTAP family purine nucleoside phosphorylase [Candidatus Magnetaquicoccus inordinatus]